MHDVIISQKTEEPSSGCVAFVIVHEQPGETKRAER